MANLSFARSPRLGGTSSSKDDPDSPSSARQLHSKRARLPASYGPGMASPLPPFKFAAHRTRIHWHTLHGVDIDKLVRSPLSCVSGLVPSYQT